MTSDKNIKILKKFLIDKPPVSFKDSKSFPSEEKIYSISGMKRFFQSIDLTNSELDDSLHKIQNEKGFDLKFTLVYNHTFKEKYPYFYTGNIDNINDIVNKLEGESKDLWILNSRMGSKNK